MSGKDPNIESLTAKVSALREDFNQSLEAMNAIFDAKMEEMKAWMLEIFSNSNNGGPAGSSAPPWPFLPTQKFALPSNLLLKVQLPRMILLDMMTTILLEDSFTTRKAKACSRTTSPSVFQLVTNVLFRQVLKFQIVANLKF